jgi:hypothetical protein
MRTSTWARWATCALAMMLVIPAATSARGDSKKSLASCTSFDQTDKDDDTVEMSIHNSCSIPVDCSMSWRVVCAPSSKKRRSTHAGSAKLALTSAGTGSAQATASVCGDDAWAIDSINWSCEPNKD